MGWRRCLARSTLLVGVLLLAATPPAVAGAAPHGAGRYKVKDLQVVSGPSPFAAG